MPSSCGSVGRRGWVGYASSRYSRRTSDSYRALSWCSRAGTSPFGLMARKCGSCGRAQGEGSARCARGRERDPLEGEKVKREDAPFCRGRPRGTRTRGPSPRERSRRAARTAARGGGRQRGAQAGRRARGLTQNQPCCAVERGQLDLPDSLIGSRGQKGRRTAWKTRSWGCECFLTVCSAAPVA